MVYVSRALLAEFIICLAEESINVLFSLVSLLFTPSWVRWFTRNDRSVGRMQHTILQLVPRSQLELNDGCVV